MGKYFNPNNAVWRAVAMLTDICCLSILWVVLCLPIVTAGPATAALYFTVFKCVRSGEDGTYSHFFRSFKENFKVGALVGTLCVGAYFLLWYGYRVMVANATSYLGVAMYIAYYIALLLPVGMACYMFPMLGRFTFSVGGLISTAFKVALRHLPTTIILVLLTLEVVLFLAQTWWPLLFTPALLMLLYSLFLERIFKKYMPEPEETLPESAQ